jgi:hypothetical protein
MASTQHSTAQIMKFSSASIAILLTAASSASAFVAPSARSSSYASSSYASSYASYASSTSKLNIVVGDTAEEFAARVHFADIVQSNFPGAISNQELVQNAVSLLSNKGYNGENTLLATSLCCDELARQLEDDFNGIYGNNFNLGGLGTVYICVFVVLYLFVSFCVVSLCFVS